MRALAILGLLSGCAHLELYPPYDAFLPVHFASLPGDPYDAGYSCTVVSEWAWPAMQCTPTSGWRR
jgi:hypothetical protein